MGLQGSMLTCLIPLIAAIAPAIAQDAPGGYLERFQLAHRAYEAGDFEAARAGYEDSLELAPRNATVAFHLACTAARAGDVDEALARLVTATDWGYIDAAVADWHPALEPLHGHPEFSIVLDRMRTRAAARPERGTAFSLVRLPISRVHDRSFDDRSALVGDTLWSIARSEPIAHLRTNEEGVWMGAFDPNGNWVITGSGSGLFLWDAHTGRPVRPLSESKSSTRLPRLSFCADGSLVAANIHGGVKVWRIPSGQLVNSFGNVGCDEIVMDPSGERLVTLNGGHAFLWNVAKSRVVAKFRRVKSVGFQSSTGDLMLLKSDGSSLRVRAQDGGVLASTEQEFHFAPSAGLTQLHDEVLRSDDPCLLPDGTTAAVPCDDGSIRVFDLRNGRTLRVLAGPTDELVGIAASPTEALLASWSSSGTVRLWDVTTGLERTKLEMGKSNWFWNTKVEFSPDGGKLLLLSGAPSFTTIVLDVATGTVLFELDSELRTKDAAWSPDSRTLASVGGDQNVHLWDIDTGLVKADPLVHDEPLRHVAFHPDGIRLIVGGERLVAHLWDTSSGQRLETFGVDPENDPFNGINQVAFAEDGSLLVTTGGCYNVFCYDLDPLRQRWSIYFRSGSAALMRVCVDDATSRVALSRQPLVLGLDNGETIIELEDSSGGLTFSPGDRYLVACSGPATVVLDGTTYQTLYERREYAGGASLISAPSGYLTGDVCEALDLYLSAYGKAWASRTFVAQLYDPMRVAASAAGVLVLSPQLPLPPQTVLVPPEERTTFARELAQLTVEARSGDGVIEFEVVRDGTLLPIHFEGKTVTAQDGGARLELRLSRPTDGDLTTLLIRPISGTGVVGHATLREVRWE